MPDMYCLLNHKLTEKQIKDARNRLRVSNIVNLPEHLSKIWSNIKPEGELEIDKLSLIVNWLDNSAKKNDYILIQGEFGAVFFITDYCFSAGFTPVYATTYRKYKEKLEENGSIERMHVFKHVQFRKFKRWKKLK